MILTIRDVLTGPHGEECPPHQCVACGEDMVHRDNRKTHESSSALGQIIHREGPRDLLVGDIDLYALKWLRDVAILRLIEQKQRRQAMGRGQAIVLELLDHAIRTVAGCWAHARQGKDAAVFAQHESGVFVLRGDLGRKSDKEGAVDFLEYPVLARLDGSVVLEPKKRDELWEWMNCGPGYVSRGGRGRWWE